MSINTKVEDFQAVRLRLASPEEILKWSYGEVLKPETINYRTQRPEKDGLFCEKIFGPTKDWECYCGKYKRIRYKGVVCDKCGVEVTKSIVRRDRMGHIALAVPIAHIWFLRGVPSSIGLVLNMSAQELERVVYFASYLITEVNEDGKKEILEQIEGEYKYKLKANKKIESADIDNLKEARDRAKEEVKSICKNTVISELDYRNLSLKYASIFKAEIGTEAIQHALADIDLTLLEKQLEGEIESATDNSLQKKKIMKRLRLVQGFNKAGIRPEFMCLTVLPVIPPDLRPMVQLDGGRFATSDLNDLYRRVINRNNRLKKLIALGAPEVIARNEKRMLQEAVDALIDNSARKGQVTMAATGKKRQLKSLADMLKGKQGRFRQNLLGKRVDYSARSVIVIGPNLRLNQCGLPKTMALELFKPFVMKELIERGVAYNIRSANKFIEQGENEVWDILEEVIQGKAVLLNRAPTLHRLSVQAFHPVLIEGKAIQLHPMVCKAFNADFDGDQMAVHLPLTKEAQKEANEIMLSVKNLLKPATGNPIVFPSMDIVLGCYYLTKFEDGAPEKMQSFNTCEEAILAHDLGYLGLKTKIKLRDGAWSESSDSNRNEFFETSVGRIIFNNILPKELMFMNKVMDLSALKGLMSDSIEKVGRERTVELADQIKNLGYKYATRSGLSWGMGDLTIPKIKNELILQAEQKVDEIHNQYEEGLLTNKERKVKIIETWNEVKGEIAKAIPMTIGEFGPVSSMVSSGARGNWAVVTQMAGMKGMVANPSGETIELPIKSSFKEGFNVLEYFISTHGTRKGMADTALRTSSAGYLTRRLVDVAQDIIVTEYDCGDQDGTMVNADEHLHLGRTLKNRIAGRTALGDIKHPMTGEILVENNQQISKDKAKIIEEAGVKDIKLRSLVSCKTRRGCCQQCYGHDLGKNRLVEIGEAVGIVTAQAIGEPGTQLTMRTFHSGGVAGKDITQGLPRVEELFETRTPKGRAIISNVDGQVLDVTKEGDVKNIKIEFVDLGGGQNTGEKLVKTYTVDSDVAVLVKKGDLIVAGQQLVEGHVDLQELFELKGIEEVKKYIIAEVQQVYVSQGEDIDDKHIEIIIKQMLSRVKVRDTGDTDLLIGDVIEKAQLYDANDSIEQWNRNHSGIEDKTKNVAVADQLLMGITKASLATESFLSAASFQETARVLIGAATTGKIDRLRGLKENVIIGRLIPAGTGYVKNFGEGE